MGDTLAASRLAISTVCLSGTLEDKLRAAAAAGFAGLELLEYDLVMSSWSPARLADEATALGLSIEAYQPFHVEAVSPDLFGATLRHAERKFDVLSELGASVLVCCSSSTTRRDRRRRPGCGAAVTRWPAAPSSAASASRTKPCRGDGCVRIEDAWRVVRRVDHPALGLCLDSFHVLSHGQRS